MVMIRCLEDFDKAMESFDKIVAEVKAVAKDQEGELQLLTNRVVIDLIQSRLGTRKSKENREKSIRKINLPAAHKTQFEKKREITFSFDKPHNERSKEPYDASARNNQLIMKRKRSSEDYEDEEYDQYIEDNACKLMRKKTKKKKMKKKKTKKKKTKKNMQEFLPPPPLPTEFMNKIKSLNGSKVQLVTQKKLTSTDLSTHHDRLSLPQNQVKTKDFLDTYEKEFKDKVGIPVRVIKPSLQESELCLRRWNMTSSYLYALNSGWKSIFTDEKEKLKEGDTIQVWSFWVNNEDLSETKLWFALVNLGVWRKEDTDGSTGSTKEDTNATSGSSATSSSRQTNESSLTQNQSVEQPTSD